MKLLTFFVASVIVSTLEAKPVSNPNTKLEMMVGNFLSCLTSDGLCREVKRLYLVNNLINKCFIDKDEFGVYFYVDNKLTVAQLTDAYDIKETTCDMVVNDEIVNEDNDLYNLINDPYDYVLWSIICLLKFIILVLSIFIAKLRKNLSILREIKSPLTSASGQHKTHLHLQPIPELTTLASAPPLLKKSDYEFEEPERTVADTRASLLTSTQISSNDITPSAITACTSLNKTKNKKTTCTCHAKKQVCSDCSCARAQRPCTIYCHQPTAKNSKKNMEFECVNEFN